MIVWVDGNQSIIILITEGEECVLQVDWLDFRVQCLVSSFSLSGSIGLRVMENDDCRKPIGRLLRREVSRRLKSGRADWTYK